MIAWHKEYTSLAGKTILVTGATGLIGSNLINALMQIQGAMVIATSRSLTKLQSLFKQYQDQENFFIYEHDVYHPFDFSEFNIDYLFHAAGPQEKAVIENYPMQVINANIEGTLNCLNFLRVQKEKKNIQGRLILFSSVTVYGNNSSKDVELTENDTSVTLDLRHPAVVYSESKRISEVLCRSYCKEDPVSFVVARLSTVYGNCFYKTDTAFFEFIQKALAHENIKVKNSLLARRDNIYVDDAVSGLLTIALKGEEMGAYNISSNGNQDSFLAIDEIAQLIADVANEVINSKSKITVEVLGDKFLNQVRAPGIRLNNNKLRRLGWDMKTDIRSGIEKTIKSCLSQRRSNNFVNRS